MTEHQATEQQATEHQATEHQAASTPDAGETAVPWSGGEGRERAGRRPGPGGSSGIDAHGGRRRGRGGRGGGRGEKAIVPDADFRSYYGRQILKSPVWHHDIPAYLFLGGVAAGSSLLGAGGDLTDRPALRRTGRVASLAGIGASLGFLVNDLGRPSRLLNMLRVAKPTSPMSMGTWILTVYGPGAGVAAVAEALPLLRRRSGVVGRTARGPLGRLLGGAARPAGLSAAALAPLVASYTAVLLSDTAVPTWHDAHPQLPFVFCGSAAAASGGLALVAAPLAQTPPARALAVGGAVVELAVAHRMERAMGLSGEPLHLGHAGRLSAWSRRLTVAGALLAVAGRRSRPLSVLAGAALLGGSACTRFAVFEAGVASTKDPKYVVVPQRARVERGEAVRHPGRAPRAS